MFINEDGGVTGSIDVSRLGEVEPKTEEARAQLDALKASAEESAEASTRGLELASQGERAVGINSTGRELTDEEQEAAERSRAVQRDDVQRQQAAHDERQRAHEDRAREERIRSGRATEADRAVEAQRAQQAERASSQGGQSDDAEVERLRGEAEKAGVSVDGRWGADRLRQEIDAAKASKSGKR